MLVKPSFHPADLSWVGLNEQDIKTVLESDFNPLTNRTKAEIDNPGLRELYLMSFCPEYIYFACRFLLNLDISPMQACILYMMWTHNFPMLIGSRGLSKSFTLAVYALLKAILQQKTKIVCVGASFRQSKVLFNYCEDIINNSPVLKSIFKSSTDGAKSNPDMITIKFGQSVIYFIPLGPGGSKIRGLRANVVIADEMNSLDTDVYEIVINNFAAVSMNPIETMKRKAKIKYMRERNLDIPIELLNAGISNQSIIAGTMGFEHQPMYTYWRRYKDIIETKGENIKKAFDGANVDMSYKDFCILRLPYELIPKGFMDDKTIARAKATIHIGAYNSEYGCVPVKDTTGFFRRMLIESCVANENSVNSEYWPDWCPNTFDTIIKGSKNERYVMGVDPASDEDNFAIVIIEVHPEHQRVVYSWTTNRDKVKQQNIKENYYAYCARHIRNLCIKFNIEKIGIDAQGGGGALEEALHDEDSLKKGEVPFWPEVDPNKPQETDKMSGQHILQMIQFANYKWLANANHSMKKDFESKTLLFPQYNAILLGLAEEKSQELADSIINIEELKDELSTIVMTSTSNRERWDTPQVKTDAHKVGRLRKDRYSALLIANDLARQINKDLSGNIDDIPVEGGRAGSVKKTFDVEPMYYGNSHLVEKLGDLNYGVVRR